MTEKDIADTPGPADHRFFSPMQGNGGDGETGSSAAVTIGCGKTVNPALPGTDAAGTQIIKLRGEGAEGHITA